MSEPEKKGNVVSVPKKRQGKREVAVVQATPMAMIERALFSGASIEVISKLMDLQERWEKGEARKAYASAISEAKADIPIIRKKKHVGFASRKAGATDTSYMHEDLGEIVLIIGPILARHGLSHRFRTHSKPGEPVTVTCIIEHRAGHSEENSLTAGADQSGNKNSIQAIGSTVTYLQRYTLKAALGLAAAADDDANAATPVISDEQVEKLQGMIVKAKANISKMCEHFQIGSLPDLPAARYDEAIGMVMFKAGQEMLAKGEAAAATKGEKA